ncbi:RGS-domain-containing protein [Aaosphaeria arxii CBS 175.79]|uniref:RGS-domain-containing protein n=1 Tax=Aaosphaeria arxii CBS 175.79 TaxID=1450172 RepID=A0A6A5XLV4_9PLEO|nr:RGS-domain-containing protein [Aaosphaeria arxii CBS 175.79]KAF2013849.1 RGS-domain-containing protein [Aaosphaeria arxii CBS 175.79]
MPYYTSNSLPFTTTITTPTAAVAATSSTSTSTSTTAPATPTTTTTTTTPAAPATSTSATQPAPSQNNQPSRPSTLSAQFNQHKSDSSSSTSSTSSASLSPSPSASPAPLATDNSTGVQDVNVPPSVEQQLQQQQQQQRRRRSTLTSLLRKDVPLTSSLSFSRGRLQQSTNTRSRDPSISNSIRSSSKEDLFDPSSTHLRTSTSAVSINERLTPEHTAASTLARSIDSTPSSASANLAGKKMHQTSSRLLRMTDDERPFTRDFKDLFATLMVSLPLTPHRVRFRMIDNTFTTDEAITNLGSLKFSQSNRMPDPKDSSRVVTTTTTTTFSMAKEMARSVCNKFLEAKFIESVEGKLDFTNKSSVWQLTPKGIHILERFCSRNGIQSAHVKHVIESQRNPHQLVTLERDTDTDKLHHDEQTIEILFRRFCGASANETVNSDSDSIHEFSRCDVGVRMSKHKPTASRPYEHIFTGKATVDWLMDCCTMVDRREGHEIGQLFVELRLIAPVDPRQEKFVPSKQTHYYVTQHGEQIAGWTLLDESTIPADSGNVKAREGAARDSNSNRTNVIIRNPSWRLLYREFLKETMCEENLSFYLEVQEFNSQYKSAINTSGDHKIETIRETLAAAYGLYNAFLAPGSPNELNIDHALRTQLATRMTRAVGDDTAMMQSLVEVALLFEKAQNSIFKLMSSDSVPKFIKHPKYGPQLRGLDAAAAQAYATSTR